jgi:hypothetical protein
MIICSLTQLFAWESLQRNCSTVELSGVVDLLVLMFLCSCLDDNLQVLYTVHLLVNPLPSDL